LAARKPDNRTVLLQALVAYKLKIYGYTKEELAVKLSMCPASLYNKLNKPDSFTVKELRTLFDTFSFTQEEKLNII
jgi:hypothetical protein